MTSYVGELSIEVLIADSYDPFLSGPVVTELNFRACVRLKTASPPICCSVTGLFWLARPTGVEANNNYNTAACHSFRQAWILPSDLSSLLSQEQGLSVIMCYSEWWLFCFYAAILEDLFFSLMKRTSSRDRTKRGVQPIWLSGPNPWPLCSITSISLNYK